VHTPYVDIHTHRIAASRGSIDLVCVEPSTLDGLRTADNFWCCGIHPWRASDPSATQEFAKIGGFVDKNCLSAIGETGFDRANRSSSIEDQKRLFDLHARLSEEANLPLVLHCVRAVGDVLSSHKRLRPRSPWLIHGLASSRKELDQILSRGIALSLGPRELARPGAKERIASIPRNLLFLETDDSPISIDHVYHTAADLLECPIEDLARDLHANWIRWFDRR